MIAFVGSTRMPWLRTRWPSTLTRPSSISSSQARREPTPAAARTFCSRTPSSLGSRSGVARRSIVPLLTVIQLAGLDLVFDICGAGQQRSQVRQFVQALEAHPLQEVPGGAVQQRTGLVLGAALLHQTTGQQGPHHAVAVDAADG